MSINFLLLVVISVVLGAPLAMGVLTSGLAVFAFVIVVWIVAVCLHEFGHAATADAGGDHTVRGKGYLTLDPVHYADPVTSLIIPVAILALGGIGFPGAAVYIRHDLLRSALWQSGVSLAGPAMTGVAMLGLALPFLLGVIGDTAPAFRVALAMLVFLQATALILNLLPIPGLDGFGVIEPFLPPAVQRAIAPVRNYAFMALFAILILVPGAAAPLFVGSFALLNTLGVPTEWVFEGLDVFKFWEG
jgi:Zn-dependent protease